MLRLSKHLKKLLANYHLMNGLKLSQLLGKIEIKTRVHAQRWSGDQFNRPIIQTNVQLQSEWTKIMA